ncbi:MAG: hypothetical protein ABIG39_04690 [Candidatus Micrarchaeota archaeon]
MSEFSMHSSRIRAKRQVREFGLGPEKVAKITFFGTGLLAPKTANIIKKADMFEESGLMFPRRNLVVSSNILEEGVIVSGSRKGWGAERLRHDGASKEAFGQWSDRIIWPLVEELFEGRHIYIRSDAFGDSLGRGVYESVPFANMQGRYGGDEERKRSFSNGLFGIIRSYFSDTAKAFREVSGVSIPGMTALLSQFIGEPSTSTFNDRRILMPFMSAIVKSTLFGGSPGKGLIRFEYGMGKGAISGRSILIDNGKAIETIVERSRKQGLYCSWIGSKVTGFDLGHSQDVVFDDTKWMVMSSILSGAYPMEKGKGIEGHAKELLRWLVKMVPRLEDKNGGPIYLELISSSFRNKLKWFVVQNADYQPMHQIPPPPKDVQFVSNADFCGHGEVKGNKQIFVFSRESFEKHKANETMDKIAEINRTYQDFVVVLPQEALTGTNLTDLSGTHLSNASVVLEYQSIGDEFWRGTVHQRSSSEHFEQLVRDLETMFVPVEKLKLEGIELKTEKDGPLVIRGDVHIACDKERHIAWGSLRNLRALV